MHKKDKQNFTVKNVTAEMSTKLQVKANEALNRVVVAELRYFKAKLKKLKAGSSTQRENIPVPPTDSTLFNKGDLEPATEDATEVIVDDDQGPSSSKKPRNSSKAFASLSAKQQGRETQSIYQSLQEFVSLQNDKREGQEEFTVTNLLGYLLRRENHLQDKEVADIGERLLNNTPQEQQGLNRTEAVVLMHDLELSKEGMRKLKHYWPKIPGITVPFEERKKLRPEIKPLKEFSSNPHETYSGAVVSYRELITQTTGSVLDVVHLRDPQLLSTFISFVMHYKEGADGAGSQSVMRSASMFNAAENMYQHAIVPLRMEGVKSNGDTAVIWKNESPNSAYSCRPQALIRSKEDKALLEYDFTYTEAEQKELEASPIIIRSFRNPDRSYQVRHQIMDSMKDLKLKKSLSGCGGAACLLCMSKKADWKNIKLVEKGFPIERTREVVNEIYAQMMEDEAVGVKTKSDKRKGVTSKPITTSDQVHICVLHGLINCTNWFLKVLARLECEYLQWIEKATSLGDPIRHATDRVQRKFDIEMGLRLNMVNRSNEKTGGSTTGNDGRDFFRDRVDEARAVILEVVPAKFHVQIKELHTKISAILRIISCEEKVDVEAFRQLTLETNLLIAR